MTGISSDRFFMTLECLHKFPSVFHFYWYFKEFLSHLVQFFMTDFTGIVLARFLDYLLSCYKICCSQTRRDNSSNY